MPAAEEEKFVGSAEKRGARRGDGGAAKGRRGGEGTKGRRGGEGRRDGEAMRGEGRRSG